MNVLSLQKMPARESTIDYLCNPFVFCKYEIEEIDRGAANVAITNVECIYDNELNYGSPAVDVTIRRLYVEKF